MKKLISLLLCVFLLWANVYAADNPFYLYQYDMSKSAEPIDNPKDLRIPEEALSFSYSFAEREIQYSDFQIQPIDEDTDILLCFRSDSKPHKLKMTLYKVEIGKDANTEIYSKVITVSEKWEKFFIESKYLKKYRTYYISLSEPKIEGSPAPEAAGTVIGCGTRGSKSEVVISRGRFAQMLTEFVPADRETPQTVFTDIYAGSQYYDEISLLEGLGVAKGVADGLYLPKENITYAQAFNMAARLFATDEEISAAGSYPAGGVTVCASLGLSEGIAADIDAPLTLTESEILLMNMRNHIDDVRKF